MLTRKKIVTMGSVLDYIAGNYLKNPAGAELSQRAQDLVSLSFADIDEGHFVDHHMHILGLGTDGSGIWLSGDLFSLLHPMNSLKTQAYISAAGIENKGRGRS